MGEHEPLLGGRFEIQTDAGAASGAFADVVRARDLQTGADVAVKRLRALEIDPNARQRFEREARLLARVDHPHLVRYVAHGFDAHQRMYLALEWLEGTDLAERQRRAPLERAEAVEVVRQAALGLFALHQAGIVHRDVKPSNFFLRARADGGTHVKLIDLGIARAHAEPGLTMDGFRVGTPAYMSPEQARGEDAVSAHSDVFSLGVVLYELLAGRRPFAGGDVCAVLAKIVLSEAPPLEELVPDVSPHLAAVVARAMARSPAERFPSAGEFAAALGALLAVGAVSAPGGVTDTARGARGDGGDDGVHGDDGPTLVRSAERSTQSAVEPGVRSASALSASGPRSGERRVVTVLFAQLTHPRRFEGGAGVENDDAEAERVAFATATTAQRAVVYRTLGERAIAVFGHARSLGDEAPRAARAALAVQQLLPGARLAVVTCTVLTRGDTLPGEAVERGAAELERAQGEVALDEASARLLEAQFVVRADPRGGFVLGDERPAADELGLRVLGAPTPTVGREREIAALCATLEGVCDERVARAVLVTGPAGMGKSRVRYEFLQRARALASPPEIWQARGGALGAGSPFGMIAQLVRAAAGLREEASPGERRAALLARVARAVPRADVARVAAFLGELSGTSFSDEGSVQLRMARSDPIALGDQMRRAWEDFLAGACEAGPVLIVLEDLHRGDYPTVAFLDAALRVVTDAPWMLAAFARPEVHALFPRLWAGRALTEMTLTALPRRAAEKLVRQVLGPGAGDARVARLCERAAGNAFFLEELIRAEASGRATEAALPETVLALLQQRLDALEPRARRALRTASVFGRSFWIRGVRDLLASVGRGEDGGEWRAAEVGHEHGHGGAGGGAGGDDDDDVLARTFARLAQHELVSVRRESRFASETEYGFRHDLVREGAYAALGPAERARYHQRAGQWLAERGETDALVLAEHFERGEEPEIAAAQYARAAAHALEGNDFAAALARVERALACGAQGEALGALRVVQAEAHKWRGEISECARAAADAMALLPPGSTRWFRAAAERAMACGKLGRSADVADVAALLAETDPGRGDAHAAAALALAVERLMQSGQRALVPALAARAVQMQGVGADENPRRDAFVHRLHGIRALFAGDHGEYLRHEEAAAACYEAAGDLRHACAQRASVGYGFLCIGAHGRAEAALRDALAQSERMGLVPVASAARHNLGLALALQGVGDEGLACERAAVADFVRQGNVRMEAGSRIYLAMIHAMRGELAAAEGEARAALTHLSPSMPLRPAALAQLARVLLEAGRAAEALVHARAAVELLTGSHGDEGAEALVALAHAEALHATGDTAAARGAIAGARARIVERAGRISDPVWRESFLGNVPEHARTEALWRAWGGGEAD